MLQGLVDVGEVDLFCTVSERSDLVAGAVVPAPNGLAHLHIHKRAPLHSSAAGLWRWLAGDWPRAVALRDWAGAAATLAAVRNDPYDLVWFSHGDVWLALDRTSDPAVVVDLDNLQSEILRIQAGATPGTEAAWSDRLRTAVRRRADTLDAGRWRAAEHRAAERARWAIVCSDLDAARLGHPRTAVIPNGFEEQPPPPPAAGRLLAMVGLLVYKPNLDGARWFVDEVLPLVQQRVPDATLRLIGRYDDRAVPLGRATGVELVGEVDDVGAALAGTAAVVAPILSGSGTRIKILEAFARRYPVASTSLGCEGLDVRDGTDLLVGDSAAELADACVRLLEDPATARAVADAGWAVWDKSYRWSTIQQRVRDLVASACGTDV